MNIIREKLFLHEAAKFYTIADNFFNKAIEPIDKKKNLFRLNKRRFSYMFLSFAYMLEAFNNLSKSRMVVIKHIRKKETKCLKK